MPAPAGLRVLEIAQGIAGPLCGRLFAGFGHDVIKCEPPGGDRQRSAEPAAPDGLSFWFTTLNGAKRGMIADLSDPASRAPVEQLIGAADVIICDLSPAEAQKLGWDEESISARWPSAVWVWVSGFGHQATGLADLPDDSLLAESYAGLSYIVGDPGRQPLALGGEQAAYAAGFAAYLAARLALLRRDAGGGGDIADVASTDVAAFLDWKSDVSACEIGEVPVRNATTSWWRVLPAADGFVGLIYHERDWPKVANLVGDQRLADPRFATAPGRIAGMGEWLPAVATWIAERPAQVVYHEAQRVGLPFGTVASMADLATDPQYRARGFIRGTDDAPEIGPPWQMAGVPWRAGPPPRPAAQAQWLERAEPAAPAAARSEAPKTPAAPPRQAPLHGVVVLDLGTITAGAAAGRLLADYGATVIKVENPEHPDPFRRWAAASGVAAGDSPLFEANNAGKLGVALDLKSQDGRRALLRLAESADVLIENYRVGVTERLGISFGELSKVNPELIYLSLASQGQDGPQARYSSYGSTLDLVSGLSSVTGYLDGPPVWSSYLLNYPDQLASLAGAALVVHCVAEGLAGTHIDLSQRELVSWTLAGLPGGPAGHGADGRAEREPEAAGGTARRLPMPGHGPLGCRRLLLGCAAGGTGGGAGDHAGLERSGGRGPDGRRLEQHQDTRGVRHGAADGRSAGGAGAGRTRPGRGGTLQPAPRVHRRADRHADQRVPLPAAELRAADAREGPGGRRAQRKVRTATTPELSGTFKPASAGRSDQRPHQLAEPLREVVRRSRGGDGMGYDDVHPPGHADRLAKLTGDVARGPEHRECLGGRRGQEAHQLARGDQVGRVVKVRPDPLPELSHRRSVPAQAGLAEERGRVLIESRRYRSCDGRRLAGGMRRDGVQHQADPDARRLTARLPGPGAHGVDGRPEAGRAAPDAQVHPVGDTTGHAQRLRPARRDPDRHRPGVHQPRRAGGAEVGRALPLARGE